MRVLWWFATLTVVSFVTIILSEENAFDSFKNLTLTVSAPAESAMRDAASPLRVADGSTNACLKGACGRSSTAVTLPMRMAGG